VTQPPPPSQPPPPAPGTRLDTPAPAGPVDVPAAGWGAGRALAGLAILLVITAVGAGIVAGFDGGEIDSLAARLSAQLILAASLVGVAFFAVQSASPPPGRPEWSHLGLRRPLRPAVTPAIVAYLGYIGIALAIAALLSPEQEDVTRELGVDEGTFGAICAGLLIVVAAPLSEEIFFRGFLYRILRSKMGLWPAVVINGSLFGAVHVTSGGPLAVAVIAPLGFLLCLVYERSGSLYPCIALHALNNAIVSAAEFDRVSGIALMMGAGMLLLCLVGGLGSRVKPGPRVRMVA
jgi:uncharacterized protein